MADRQDIDALLVGALYGELDASERARLDAHLSSHPEDRASLDAMERTRAQVRRGMAELPEAEPSPSISTLLMAAAKQGVPRPVAVAAEPREETEGLWSRFVAWLLPVARHPGFAAMAALVLVAGTATALWLRDAGKVSEPEMQPSASRAADTGVSGAGSASASAAATATATPSDPSDRLRETDKDGEKAQGYGSGSAAGSGSYRVDLANEDRALQQQAQVAQKPTAHHAGRQATASAAGKAASHADNAPGMVVQTQGLDAVDIKDVTADDELEKGASGTATGATAGGGAAAPAPAAAGAVEPKPANPGLDAWASNEHQRLIQLVNAGKCPDAGKLGAEIKDKAPEYYAANIANDRRIRQCKQYIEGQAKRKADKAYKSRSQSNTVDQPAEADQ